MNRITLHSVLPDIFQSKEELSSEITKGLEIIPVETMEEVLKKALTR